MKEDAGPSFAIFGGGPEPEPQRLRPFLCPDALVIAADGGWRLCRDLGLRATVLVGDMDTLEPEEVEQAQNEGCQLHRYSSDKDQSDLELAILAAYRMGGQRMTILGALGGQWDHCLANLLAPLSLCRSLGVWARLVTAGAEIYLLDSGSYVLKVASGTRVSLAALSAEIHGLSLTGFTYPLQSAKLERQQTLGLANAVKDPVARVELTSGELLVTLIV